MFVVIDTNILVSALWSRGGAPATVIGMVLRGAITPCYDYRIMCEYREVLQRPKFCFTKGEINSLLDWFQTSGQSVIADQLSEAFIDEADKKFYEVARYCNATLITGNLIHFPKAPNIMSAADFLALNKNHQA